MLALRLDDRTGVATYLQIVQQVKQALRLGVLTPGDQLPTVKDVATQLAINPNTVLKAYRELERDGVVVPKQGVGTFVRDELAPPIDLRKHAALRRDLQRWLTAARRAGLDDDSVDALWNDTFRGGSWDAEDIA